MQATTTPSIVEWLLDSGVSSHLSNETDQLINAMLYNGSDHVEVGNRQSVTINYIGHDILPTPSRKLLFSQIYHSQKLSHNILYANKLVLDNNCLIIFYANVYIIKEKMTNQAHL